MPVFSPIPGGTVILKSAGIYRQADLYHYDERLFAKSGSGFIALHRDGLTSVTKVTYESLECEPKLETRVGKTALYIKP